MKDFVLALTIITGLCSNIFAGQTNSGNFATEPRRLGVSTRLDTFVSLIHLDVPPRRIVPENESSFITIATTHSYSKIQRVFSNDTVSWTTYFGNYGSEINRTAFPTGYIHRPSPTYIVNEGRPTSRVVSDSLRCEATGATIPTLSSDRSQEGFIFVSVFCQFNYTQGIIGSFLEKYSLATGELVSRTAFPGVKLKLFTQSGFYGFTAIAEGLGGWTLATHSFPPQTTPNQYSVLLPESQVRHLSAFDEYARIKLVRFDGSANVQSVTPLYLTGDRQEQFPLLTDVDDVHVLDSGSGADQFLVSGRIQPQMGNAIPVVFSVTVQRPRQNRQCAPTNPCQSTLNWYKSVGNPNQHGFAGKCSSAISLRHGVAFAFNNMVGQLNYEGVEVFRTAFTQNETFVVKDIFFDNQSILIGGEVRNQNLNYEVRLTRFDIRGREATQLRDVRTAGAVVSGEGLSSFSNHQRSYGVFYTEEYWRSGTSYFRPVLLEIPIDFVR